MNNNSSEQQSRSSNKLKEIDDLIKEFEEDIRFVNDSKQVNVSGLSTGLIFLDDATNVNGFPSGRIVEIFGPLSTGKSSLCFRLMANNSEKVTLYFDAEGGLDINYLKKNNVNTDNLIVSHNTCGERIFEIIENALEYENISLIIIDSVAAMIPKEVIENPLQSRKYPVHAMMMSSGLNRLINKLNDKNTCVIFINQVRENIGTSTSSTRTPGGRALGFYASMRIELKRISWIDSNETSLGSVIEAGLKKNKCGSAFKKANLCLVNGYGFDVDFTEVEGAIECGIISKSSSWFKLGEYVAQGKLNFIKLIKNNQQAKKALKHSIKHYLESR